MCSWYDVSTIAIDYEQDSINRRVSMEMLLNLAQSRPNRQWILITPQDVSTVEMSETVRIFSVQKVSNRNPTGRQEEKIA
jgi:hypothetical protein